MVVAAVMLATGLSACGSSSGGSGDQYTVGLVAFDAAQVTALEDREGAKAAMEERGWEVIELNANGDPAAAIGAMQNLVQRKVDVISVQVFTPDQLTTGIATAKSAGIPVFSSVSGDVGGDLAGAVELVGSEAVNEPFVAELEKLGKVELLQLNYTPGAPCRARQEDLKKRLADLPDVTVSEQEVRVPGPQQSAQQATAGWLQSRQDSDDTTLVIWPCFGEGALGAIAAEKQLGRGPYMLYTWDLSDATTGALRDGDITAILWIKAEEGGQMLVDMISEYRESPESWEPKTISAPTVLLTEDNISEYDDYVAPSGD
ncbi:sugar ABC transporter substrate-binding protein [Aeromicrobium sp. CF4.19]|uniref:sugar ABC transporter substrate-binding protein n=1 Tax=Aeromicrobium sp. CF4.19 TaxID=3373082 RepID=UPI003EE53E4D